MMLVGGHGRYTTLKEMRIPKIYGYVAISKKHLRGHFQSILGE
jgi:hypothetical protein